MSKIVQDGVNYTGPTLTDGSRRAGQLVAAYQELPSKARDGSPRKKAKHSAKSCKGGAEESAPALSAADFAVQAANHAVASHDAKEGIAKNNSSTEERGGAAPAVSLLYDASVRRRRRQEHQGGSR